MQPLRYSINVTLDGCCDHRAVSVETLDDCLDRGVGAHRDSRSWLIHAKDNGPKT